MVARFVRLRLALLGSAFRGGARRATRSSLIGIIAIAFAVALAWFPVWMARSESELVAIDTVITSLLLIAVAIVPIFSKVGLLEPRQFGALPGSRARIATSMLLSSILTWPALWLIVWMLAQLVFRPQLLQLSWQPSVAAVLTLALAIALAQVSAAYAKSFVSRRAVSLLRWIGLLLLLAVLPIAVFTLTETLRSPDSRVMFDIAAPLAWTPFGAPAAGLGFVSVADDSAAITRFLIAIGTLVALIALWYLLVAKALTTIEAPMSARAGSDGLEFFERFPAKPREVIAARSLTYWLRDPRYRVALFAIPFAPAVMLIALWIAGVEPQVLAYLPLPVILVLLGWAVHNDVALDSTAIWMHVASGTRGHYDRAGRLAPVMAIGLPLVIVGSSISVTIGGDWRVLPAVIGLNAGVLLVSAGVSSVFSVLMPYPATRPGDSPFAQPAVQGSGAGLAQTLSMLVTLVCSAAPVIIAAGAIIEPTFEATIGALAFGVAWGIVVLALGIWIGGKLFNRNAPELVALTQTFD